MTLPPRCWQVSLIVRDDGNRTKGLLLALNATHRAYGSDMTVVADMCCRATRADIAERVVVRSAQRLGMHVIGAAVAPAH